MGVRILDRVIDHPRRVLFALLLTTGMAVVGISRLKFEESPRDVFTISPEVTAQLDHVEQSFGSDQSDCYVILHGTPIFSPEGIRALRGLVRGARSIEGIDSVYSVLDIRRRGHLRLPLVPAADAPADLIVRRRDEALQHPLVAGHLLAKDGNAALIPIRLKGNRLDANQIAAVLHELETVLQDVTAGTSLQTAVTGMAAINCEIVRTVKWVMVWFGIAATVICLGIAMAIFRSLSAASVAFVAPLIGCLWSLGVLSAAGVRLNVVQSIMPTLIVATGFSDVVHLMYHFRGLLGQGIAKPQAARETIAELAPACLLTSMTTAIGFGSLALSPLPVIRVFGLACALGCVLTLGSVLMTFVAMYSYVSFARSVPSESRWTRGALDRVFAAVARAPKLIVIASVLAVLAMAPCFVQLRPDYRYRYSLPQGGEAIQSLQLCDEYFGGCLPLQVLVSWPEGRGQPADLLPAVNRIHALLNDDDRLTPPISILSVVAALSRDRNLADDWARLDRLPPQATQRLLRKDRRDLIVVSRITDAGALQITESLDNVRAGLRELKQEYPYLQLELTGMIPVAFDSVEQIIRDLSSCLIVASTVIFVVLTLAFRSVTLGLASVVPNAFPVVALAAILAAWNQPLTYASVLVFMIALGIAVDDTIHFIFRYQRSRSRGEAIEPAVRSAYETVGPAMLTTTTIFIAAFASLRMSTIPQHHTLAILCGMAMVLALIGDLVILPALLLWGNREGVRRAGQGASARTSDTP